MTSISTFLDGNVPTQLRGLAWLALSDTGHVLTTTWVDDGGGGATEVETPGADIPCRVDPVGAKSGTIAGQLDERSTHVISVPPATAVSESDRFVVDGTGTYEITAVRTRTREAIRELEAVEA